MTCTSKYYAMIIVDGRPRGYNWIQLGIFFVMWKFRGMYEWFRYNDNGGWYVMIMADKRPAIKHGWITCCHIIYFHENDNVVDKI